MKRDMVHFDFVLMGLADVNFSNMRCIYVQRAVSIKRTSQSGLLGFHWERQKA